MPLTEFLMKKFLAFKIAEEWKKTDVIYVVEKS